MQTRVSYLLVIPVAASLLAAQSVRTQQNYATSVNATSVEHRYLRPIKSIRTVDFTNLWYFIGAGKSGDLFQLRNGKIKIKYKNFGGDEYTLGQVYYFRPSEKELQGAVVKLTHFSYGGSSSEDGILLVFQIEDGGLIVTQRLDYDEQADGTGIDFDVASNTLTIRARSNDDSPHCCPRSVDVVTFVWAGKAFEEKSHGTVAIDQE